MRIFFPHDDIFKIRKNSTEANHRSDAPIERVNPTAAVHCCSALQQCSALQVHCRCTAVHLSAPQRPKHRVWLEMFTCSLRTSHSPSEHFALALFVRVIQWFLDMNPITQSLGASQIFLRLAIVSARSPSP